MMQYNNVKISSVEVKDGQYNEKKKKYVKYKEPKIIKKVVQEDNFFDLGELYNAVNFHVNNDPYRKFEVKFTAYKEW
tara:strand:+ start:211 stop:441 length:231 start_codon:yes stop_codon:yes gene_type:complete